jgi:hypothetical protein
VTQKPSTTLRGTVEKIISSRVPSGPDHVQIAIELTGALYKELRIKVNSKNDHKTQGRGLNLLGVSEFSRVAFSLATNSNRGERHQAVSYGPGERLPNRRRSE